MADSSTPKYAFVLPEVGASDDTWGTKLNSNWTKIDSLLATLLPSGSGTNPGAMLYLSGGSPVIRFRETDATLPDGQYQLGGLGTGGFYLQRHDGADFTTPVTVFRYIQTTDVFHILPKIVADSTIECDGGAQWGLKITSGYPAIWFYDDNVGGAYQHLALSAGNGWWRFGVADSNGSITEDVFTIKPSGTVISQPPIIANKGITTTSNAGVTWSLRLQDGYPTILFEDTTPSGQQRFGISGGNGSMRFGPAIADGTITPFVTWTPDIANFTSLTLRTTDGYEAGTYDTTVNRDASRLSAGGLGLQAHSSNGAATRFLAGFYSANNMTIELRRSGSSYNATGTWGAISDATLKHDIVDATPKLADVLKLRIVNYVLNSDPEQRKQIGVVSQEAGQIFPGLVDADEDGNLSFRYSVLIPILVKAMQEIYALVTKEKANGTS